MSRIRIRRRPPLPLRPARAREIPHPEVNPLGLSLREREVALDVVRSYAACVEREATILQQFFYYSHDSAHRVAHKTVFTSLIRQLRGTARSGAFELQRDVPDDDMAYVLESLEESLRGAALARELFADPFPSGEL